MQNFEDKTDATTHALNSQGSAFRENERYIDSHAARINKMSNSMTEVSLAMGEAFVNDAIVSFADSMATVARSVATFVETFGGIPTIMMATSPLIMLMNRNISAFIGGTKSATKASSSLAKAQQALATNNIRLSRSYVAGSNGAKLNTSATKVLTGAQLKQRKAKERLTTQFTRNTTATRTYANATMASTAFTRAKTFSLNALAASARAAAVALRALGVAIGIGAALMALGWIIESVTGFFRNAREEAEAFREEQEKSISTYRSSSESIDELVDSLERLENARRSGDFSNEQEEEYLRIQTELGNLLPTLVISEDEYGNKVVANSEIIREQIKLLEEQIKAKDKIIKQDAEFNLSQDRSSIEEDIKAQERLTERIENQMKRRSELVEMRQGEDDHVVLRSLNDEIEIIDEQLAKLRQRSSELTSDIIDGKMRIQTIIDTVVQGSESLLDTDYDFLDSLGLNADDLAIAGENLAKLRSILGDTFDVSELSTFDGAMKSALSSVAEAVSSGGDNWERYNDILVEHGFSVEDATDAINHMHDAMNAENHVAYLDAMGNQGVTIEELNDLIDENTVLYDSNGDVIEDNTQLLDDNTDAKKDQIEITKLLYGVTQDSIEQAEYHLRVYEALSESERLNEQQKNALSEATNFLTNTYPHLIENGQIRIGQIGKEIEADRMLLSAHASMGTGRMTNEERITSNAIQESSNRIRQYQLEIEAINGVIDGIRSNQNLNVMSRLMYENNLGALQSVRSNITQTRVGIQRDRQGLISDFNAMVQANNPTRVGSPDFERGGGSSSGGSASSPSSRADSSSSQQEARHRDHMDTLIRNINLEQALLEAENNRINQQISNARTQGDLNKELELTNQLLENQEKRSKLLRKANEDLHQEANKIRDVHKQFNTEGWFDVNGDETLQFVKEYNNASHEQQEVMLAVFDSLQKLKKAYGENSDEVRNLKNSIKDLNRTNEELARQVADDVVDIYKDMYSKQQQITNDALSQRLRSLERAHNREMDMIDERQSRYDEAAQAQIDLIDRQASEEDHEKQLSKLQEDELKIRKRITLLSLDNSMEAQAEKFKLEEDLQKQLERIDDLELARSRQLRKESIQEDMQEKRDQTQIKKDAAEEQFELAKNAIDDEQKYWDRFYDNQLNDERTFRDMREQIMKGHFHEIQNDFEEFENFMDKHMGTIGESISHNLIDKIAEASNAINSLSNSPGSIGKSSFNHTVSRMSENASAWHSANDQQKSKLAAENQKLGNSIGAEYNSSSGEWWKDNKRLFHDGGIVGDKSSKIGLIMDDLFKMKPSERTTKSLVGELQVAPRNLKNGLKNIQNIASKHQTPQNAISIGSLMDNVTITKDTNIDSLTKQITNNLVKDLRTYGFVK